MTPEEAYKTIVNEVFKFDNNPTYELCGPTIENMVGKKMRVAIEVTENALIQSEQAILALRRLYQAGFIICLDDFGAGFSSLSYLLRLPLHVIKIDRAFVADLTVNGDSQKILYGMLAIIRSVGKGVVIEGVETAEQVQMLVALGIELIS